MAKILVVDDEPVLSEVLALNLRQQGYGVLTAGDGQTGLDLAHAEAPDLIVLDLMLPVLDGLSVCRAVRKESDVPIIMLTARGLEIDRIAGLETGADDYISVYTGSGKVAPDPISCTDPAGSDVGAAGPGVAVITTTCGVPATMRVTSRGGCVANGTPGAGVVAGEHAASSVASTRTDDSVTNHFERNTVLPPEVD